jgi:Tfp pilus assembly protein PilW
MNIRRYCLKVRRLTQHVGGFTLTEMMFTVAIGSFIMIGVMTSYIFSLKGFRSLSNYNYIQADGRRGLDWFSRDLRVGMAVTSCISNRLVVVLPQTVSSTGKVTASNSVTHAYQNGSWYRTDGSGASTLLAENVATLTFSLYNAAGAVTTQPSNAASVQVDAYLQKKVLSKAQSSDFLSARLRMRNTP